MELEQALKMCADYGAEEQNSVGFEVNAPALTAFVIEQSTRISELEAALAVLAKELYGKALDRAVGKHWDTEINDAVWENPIAAEAVREAGR